MMLSERKATTNHSNKDQNSIKSKKVFAVLLTTDDYLVGLQVLQWSLKSVQSNYPLVVLYTANTLSSNTMASLNEIGCILKPICHLSIPELELKHYAQPYYYDTWNKLQAFNLIEYERVILLDADMLVRKNIDDLMSMEIPKGWIAASPACVCNPLNIPSYPSTWTPQNCQYTHLEQMNGKGSESASETDYFNSGLIIFEPSEQIYIELQHKLKSNMDLEKYLFPDQDFLNEVFKGKWRKLCYTYNALRPLILSHPKMWNSSNIKIVHYIFTKPWKDEIWKKMSLNEKKSDQFYTVNCWWFEAYEKMISQI